MSTRPPADMDFGVLLNVAFGAFKDRLHAHLTEAGFNDLGPSYGYVFRSLADAPLSLAQLAERLGITAQGAHKIVAEMVERGYVERRDDAGDGRVRRLYLSDRGKAALRAARRFHALAERELVRQLGATQVSATRAVLEAMIPTGAGAERESALVRPF